ncbi:preprotein translocase subunit YajC [Novosphingobium sp. FSY-8]|uniref:Preprotein translocase subunit YajC n=1 Tax=Novosphingobium ovatum TaxID=1908523 RepID=A0ABW9XBZ9_9SPHN|nr:preprotein translocase subunit YajC [Novosphingobium ovatum]NBC36072.1 preprotein translocase subunit YajC [Novosphingobium ovatum]
MTQKAHNMQRGGRGLGHSTALAAALAVVGLFGPVAPALAQPTAATSTGTVGNVLAYQAITPDLSIRDLQPSLTGDDGSHRDVTGQTTTITNPDPYQAYTYDVDVTYSQVDPNTSARSGTRREGPQSRSRYYGSAFSGQNSDLTGAETTSDEEFRSTRGKGSLRSRRLGVFDQGTADKRRFSVKPYIDASQVVQAFLTPDADVITYSVLAAGADATINGRNNQGVISARYERRIGWNRKDDGNGITGIARLSSSLVPDTLRMDYGAYANRTYATANGAAFGASGARSDTLTQIYSLYAGPTFTTQTGAVAITGHYHAGYTAVDSGSTVSSGLSTSTTDILAHSTVQDARLAIGTRAGDALPVGLGLDGGFYQEDVSNLDQRVADRHIRAEISIPVGADVALVGGAGYESTQVSSRNAVTDSSGAIVRDANGRMQTDYSQPRYLAFDSEGLIWDAGVVWRPSSRTNFEAHVGRRYGEVGVYGFFNYQPDERHAFNVVVYDGITGFGGSLTNSLFNMPTQFTTVRDAITGNLTSCVSSMQGGNCLAGALGSVNSTLYRGRGVSLSYGLDLGRWRTGLGAGYDRRRYITSAQTVLAGINGKTDQYYWVAAYFGGRLSERSIFDATLDAYHYKSGLTTNSDMNAIRAVALYQYYLSRHLTASASLAIDGIMRQDVQDAWSTSGSVGMRYTF